MRLVEFLKYTRGDIPKGTFVGVYFTPSSVKNLVEWMNEVGLQNPCDSKDLHVTLLYDDEKGFPWQNKEYSPPLELDPETFKLDIFDGTLVLRFENEELNQRHLWGIEEYDVDWKYPSYKSHVSLSYNPAQSPCDLIPPAFPLYLSYESSTLAGASGPSVPTVGESRV